MSSPMPPNMPPNMPAPPPVKKKTSPWVWILGGIAIFFFAITLTCGVVGFLAFRAVKNAGFDPDLMKQNPGLAMAKMVSAMNPNLETVKTNDRAGTITVRDKTTGKVMTMKFDPEKKQMVITGDDGKEVSFSATGSGTNSGVTVQSSEGSMKFGTAAGNSAPAWVPVYPGSSPQGTMSTQTAEGTSNAFSFKSTDAASKIISYYQDQLKAGGFTINMTTTAEQGGMIQAEDSSKKRSVIVTVGTSPEGTETAVVAVEKK